MKYITSCFIWLFVIKIKFKIIENQFDLLKFIEKKYGNIVSSRLKKFLKFNKKILKIEKHLKSFENFNYFLFNLFL